MLLLLLACAPKPAPPPVVAAPAPPPPAPPAPTPLAVRAFVLPVPGEATLSNGLRVKLVENHEVPFVYVNLAFEAGSWTDPPGKEGLAAVTMDMLNEGAGPRDSEALSREERRLGASLATEAWSDGAAINVQVLTRNLAPALDLFADVLLRPTLPASEWDVLRPQYKDALAQSRVSANSIAARVSSRVVHGDNYQGRMPSDAAYDALKIADMRAWHKANLRPDEAILLVGGDTTLSEIVPLLETRLGRWKAPKAGKRPAPPIAPKPAPAAITLVDKPGSTQAVIQVTAYGVDPRVPGWSALVLANQAVGGGFTSRLNMALREEKGWTYGTRGNVGFDLAGGAWGASGNFHLEHAAESVVEMRRIFAAAGTDQPLTSAELEDARGALVNGHPLRYENPGYLLGQERQVWRYDLQPDWITGWIDRMNGVTPTEAQSAWGRVDLTNAQYVVVGDLTKIREDIQKIGLPVSERDADGNLRSP